MLLAEFVQPGGAARIRSVGLRVDLRLRVRLFVAGGAGAGGDPGGRVLRGQLRVPPLPDRERPEDAVRRRNRLQRHPRPRRLRHWQGEA